MSLGIEPISAVQPRDVYEDSAGELWRIVAVIDRPCVILERQTGPHHVSQTERRTLVIGAPNADEFTRLVRQ